MERRNSRFQQYTKEKLIVFSVLTLPLLLIALFSENFVPYDPYLQNLNMALQPPSDSHYFGTDRYGRDLFSRVIVGAKTTIFSAISVVILVSVLGTLVGILCGYNGGKTDSILMRVSDIFLAFPGMVFAIAVAGVLGGSTMNAVIAIAAISWPKYARLARSQVLAVKNMPYMDAAKMSGSSTLKIIGKHILPNVVGTILVTSTLDIGTMMMEVAGLSFLGLGAMPPEAEWGSMMSDGRSMIQTSPWVILAPGCAIFISVMLFNLLGDTVRDLLDPRQNGH